MGRDPSDAVRRGAGDQGDRPSHGSASRDGSASVALVDAASVCAAGGGSKLDPFKDELHRLLREDPEIESQRIRELLAEQGYAGGKTITDDYVREVRPFFVEQRTFQHTVYRPGDLAQFDLWQPKREIPVGYGQTRRGYVVVGALGFSHFGAGALVFSKEAPDVCWTSPGFVESVDLPRFGGHGGF